MLAFLRLRSATNESGLLMRRTGLFPGAFPKNVRYAAAMKGPDIVTTAELLERSRKLREEARQIREEALRVSELVQKCRAPAASVLEELPGPVDVLAPSL